MAEFNGMELVRKAVQAMRDEGADKAQASTFSSLCSPRAA